MAVLPIVQTGAEVLRQKCAEVEKFDAELHSLLDDMKDTLKDAQGAGLAAPQVGVSKRIFIVDVENEGMVEFINPVILGVSGSQYGVEGCLSVKGKWGDVKRPRKVTIEACDRFGNKFKFVGRDFTAKALSHEYDHLDGILYTDKANNLREEV
ncbi:MAG: peptide deformylase [Clostridia bacterium]|nr:peptide deformylase [Clostridia bacterium]